jgi:hypothetical protein
MTTLMTDSSNADAYTGPRCQGCGGPCWSWKGSVWQYTCSGCITEYLDAAEARWAAKAAKDRERLLAKEFRGSDKTNVTNTDQRRAGAPALCTGTRPTLIATDNRRDT